MDIEGLEGTETYQMIFGTDNSASYWLASSFNRTFSGYFNTGIRVVSEGEVHRSYLRICEINCSVKSEAYGLRAVVYVPPEVEIVPTSSNTFKII